MICLEEDIMRGKCSLRKGWADSISELLKARSVSEEDIRKLLSYMH